MSKGQTSYPFTMAEAALTFLLVLGVAYGTQGFTEKFIKEELTDVQAERMRNSAMAVDSLPEGYIQINQDFSGYEYKVDGLQPDTTYTSNFQVTDQLGATNEDYLTFTTKKNHEPIVENEKPKNGDNSTGLSLKLLVDIVIPPSPMVQLLVLTK